MSFPFGVTRSKKENNSNEEPQKESIRPGNTHTTHKQAARMILHLSREKKLSAGKKQLMVKGIETSPFVTRCLLFFPLFHISNQFLATVVKGKSALLKKKRAYLALCLCPSCFFFCSGSISMQIYLDTSVGEEIVSAHFFISALFFFLLSALRFVLCIVETCRWQVLRQESRVRSISPCFHFLRMSVAATVFSLCLSKKKRARVN